MKMGDPSFLGIKLIDIAIFVLWSLICYSTGEIVGRSKYFKSKEKTEGKRSWNVKIVIEKLKTMNIVLENVAMSIMINVVKRRYKDVYVLFRFSKNMWMVRS